MTPSAGSATVAALAPEAVLDFWLGPRGETPPSPSDVQRWFEADADLDDRIRARFGEAVEAALSGGFPEWAATPAARAALIVLLDQFPRNLYRADPRAFAGDPRALALAQATDAKTLGAQHPLERYFTLVPFMHAEDLAAQRAGEAAFAAGARAVAPAFRGLFEGGESYARRHRVVIERFGRFPHRNAVLGRATTAEEAAFLAEHPTGF